MVGWLGSPSVPIAIGSRKTLFATRVATAPAAWVLRILAEKVQVPREMSAICPSSELVGSAAQALLRPPTEPATTPRGAVRSAPTVAKSPVPAPYVLPPTLTGAPM